MELYINPEPSSLPALTQRKLADDLEIEGRVAEILRTVKEKGDEGLRKIVAGIDGFVPESFRVGEKEVDEACEKLTESLKESIREAYGRIHEFHSRQVPAEVRWDDGAGTVCRRRWVPIQNVGLYVPGGSAPLFSTLLMLAIPAKIAGCGRIVLCTPAGRDGKVAPAVLFAAKLCGLTEIFAIGGSQAIAAMAYGTQSVPKVDKIFGPGNRYVLKAKQAVSREGTAIDMPAGPSEVMVLADGSAVPEFVAADLLSQAEHGPDSQVMLVCSDVSFAEKVSACIESQKAVNPRVDIIDKALSHSRIIVLPERKDKIAFANLYASEHLIISMEDAESVADEITAAGSIFLGNYTPESAGDYASGTNHTLPTSGLATAWSGLGTDSFMHAVTIQGISREGLASLSGTIMEMAEAEGLDAHANAVRIRL